MNNVISAQFCLRMKGRYTYRVAISNNRLLEIAEGKVTFRYKDYRHNAQQKTIKPSPRTHRGDATA
jgi:hypothetical protein